MVKSSVSLLRVDVKPSYSQKQMYLFTHVKVTEYDLHMISNWSVPYPKAQSVPFVKSKKNSLLCKQIENFWSLKNVKYSEYKVCPR